jgi:hypothetical protein
VLFSKHNRISPARSWICPKSSMTDQSCGRQSSGWRIQTDAFGDLLPERRSWRNRRFSRRPLFAHSCHCGTIGGCPKRDRFGCGSWGVPFACGETGRKNLEKIVRQSLIYSARTLSPAMVGLPPIHGQRRDGRQAQRERVCSGWSHRHFNTNCRALNHMLVAHPSPEGSGATG